MVVLSVNEIQELLPERGSELMVDQVLASDETSIQAHQSILETAPYFQGHFPGEPVVPGVLLVEGLQQSARLWLKLHHQVTHIELVALQRVKFRKTVTPGSELTYHVELTETTAQDFHFTGTVMLGDEKAASAKFTLHTVMA